MSRTKPISDNGGFVPPQDQEIEKQVLSAMLVAEDSHAEIVAIVQRPEVFYNPKHQVIYAALLQMYQETRPIDMLSLMAFLKKSGKMDQAGGEAYIIEITTVYLGLSRLDYHCRILMQHYLKREMYRAASAMAGDSVADTSDVFQLLERHQKMLDDLSGQIAGTETESWQFILNAIQQDLEKLSNSKELTGVPSGLQQIDKHLGGFQGGELYILAARPGMGKTAMAVKWLVSAAKAGVPVAVFQLEMNSVQFGKRILAVEAQGLHANHFYKHGLKKESEWKKFMDVVTATEHLPLHILPKPGLNVFECTREARRLKKKHDIGLIVVDYLQLMGGANLGRNSNREQEISEVSRELKKLSLELNVPVIALSQLSRAVETRAGDKRPRLSDLRESGSIEQDADAVLFLYRPEYYGYDVTESGESAAGVCEVIISKHRNGGLGFVEVGFDDNKVRFLDLDELRAQPQVLEEGQF